MTKEQVEKLRATVEALEATRDIQIISYRDAHDPVSTKNALRAALELVEAVEWCEKHQASVSFNIGDVTVMPFRHNENNDFFCHNTLVEAVEEAKKE